MFFNGFYYNGKDSGRIPVSAENSGDTLIIRADDGELCRYVLSETDIKCGAGSSPSYLYFSDGSSMETPDGDAAHSLLEILGREKMERLARRLENKWRYVAAALAFTVLFSLFLLFYAVPVLAKAVAFSLPPETNRLLGDKTLEILDAHFFKESGLGSAEKERITAVFDDLAKDLPAGFDTRLVFRTGGRIGANAMALPDGTVVVTDELVKMADSDYETAAVLAHELGHLEMRHGIRTALQGSVLAAVAAAVTGDVSSLTVGIPAVLTQAKYSREFEREADKYAINLLSEHHISAKYFETILTKLTKGHKDNGGMAADFFSTHPSSDERIKDIRKAAENE